jgi:hypothetical protein
MRGVARPFGEAQPLSCEARLAATRKSGAIVQRGGKTSRPRDGFGISWLCSRFLTTAEVDERRVARDLR